MIANIKNIFTCLIIFLSLFSSEAVSDDFYHGRQILLVIGNNAGTAYDASARLVARHLGRHIPGNPTLVVQNMPGATGLTAANHVFNIAPRDGTVISNAHQSLPLRQLMGESAVSYDVTKVHWIGSPEQSNNVIAVWHTVPVTSFDDVRSRETIMGSTTARAANYVELALANNLLGTRFRQITGYRAPDIDLAMERGEVEGRAGQSWAGMKATKGDWIHDEKIRVIAQIGLRRESDLPHVPLLQEFAIDSVSKSVIEMYSSQIAMGRALYAPPDVPMDRVTKLRNAFASMIKDNMFLQDAKNTNHEITLVDADEITNTVNDLMNQPEYLIPRLIDAQK